MSNGPLNRPAAGHPGVESFRGIPFTPAAGITTTPVDSTGNLTRLETRSLGSSAPVRRQCNASRISGNGRSTCTSSAHAVFGRRARQQVDGSRVGRFSGAGWQKRRMENFNVLVSGGSSPRSRTRWLDGYHPQPAVPAADSKQGISAELLGKNGDRRFPEDESSPRPRDNCAMLRRPKR